VEIESISIVLGRESGQDSSSAVIVGVVVARGISGLFVGVIISTAADGAKVSGPLSPLVGASVVVKSAVVCFGVGAYVGKPGPEPPWISFSVSSNVGAYVG